MMIKKMKFVLILHTLLILLLVHNVYSRRSGTKPQQLKLRKPLRPDEITKVYDPSDRISLRSPFIINSNDFIRYRNVPTAKVIPHEDSCKPPHLNKLDKTNGSVACKLMETIVHIESVDQSMLTPSAVLVNRCLGVCGTNQKKQCIALKSKDRAFPIRQIIKSSNQIKCLTVVVSEDIECGCGCPQKETDCKMDVQRYNKDRCLCECVNDHEYKKCKERVGKNWEWDDKKCVCKCKKVKVCTTGAKFNEKHCKCKKEK